MTSLFREMERVSQKFTTAIRGITVEKSVWANGEGLSVVRFEISSERDDPVRLRLVESVPDDFAMENLGPHPKYDGDKWEKTETREFVFTNRLEPGGEAFTLYGIKGLSQSNLESFLTDVGVEIDPIDDEPASDSDDSPTMTDDTPTDSELDEDTIADDTDFEPQSDFNARIPRVEDLRSAPGSWSTSKTNGSNTAADIQFVGSNVESSGTDGASDSEPGSPIELADPTVGDDETNDPEADTEVSAEASTSDSSDSPVETDRPEADEADASTADESTDDPTDEVADADAETSLDSSDGTDVATVDPVAEQDADDTEVADDTGTPDVEADDDAGSTDLDSDESDETEEASAVVETEEASAVVETEEMSDTKEPDLTESEGVVAELVAELSSRELSDHEVAVLRAALGTPEPNSLDVRLGHVQNRVDNLAAYTDALEDFLDENGTAEQVVEDLQTETTEMRDDIEALRSALSASESAIEAIESQVDSIEDRMVAEDTFEDRLADLDERLVSQSELEAQVEELGDDLASIRADVETGKTWRSNLSQAIQLPGMMQEQSQEADSTDSDAADSDSAEPESPEQQS